MPDEGDSVAVSADGTILTKRPERILYRAVRNLLLNEWGLTKKSLIGDVIGSFQLDAEKVIRDWMNGEHIRAFVGKVCRETVKALAEPIIKAEARAFLDRRVKLKAEITATVTPEETVQP